MNTKNKPVITVFHCINAAGGGKGLPPVKSEEATVKSVKLACSGMTKDVYLLRAFEAGADAVVTLACPEPACRHIEGGVRARKRVERVKKLLDEIGLDGRRLTIHNVSPGDETAFRTIIENTLADLSELGPALPEGA
ncbi:MAG: hydrogenase iron-sulfur subunit [Desulfobacterales bacterium]|nr:hydrogenase iron-sulfur subunit [Desulfobacterales bacterium]